MKISNCVSQRNKLNNEIKKQHVAKSVKKLLIKI